MNESMNQPMSQKFYLTRFALVAVVFAVSLGCSKEHVEIDFDSGQDFSVYKTFAWPAVEKVDSDTKRLIRQTIERELVARGLQLSESNADLIVYVHMAPEMRSSPNSSISWSTSYDPAWGTRSQASYSMDAGSVVGTNTLVIDLVDGEKDALVWRGSEPGLYMEGDVFSETIPKVVKQILARYPPK